MNFLKAIAFKETVFFKRSAIDEIVAFILLDQIP